MILSVVTLFCVTATQIYLRLFIELPLKQHSCRCRQVRSFSQVIFELHSSEEIIIEITLRLLWLYVSYDLAHEPGAAIVLYAHL